MRISVRVEQPKIFRLNTSVTSAGQHQPDVMRTEVVSATEGRFGRSVPKRSLTRFALSSGARAGSSCVVFGHVSRRQDQPSA